MLAELDLSLPQYRLLSYLNLGETQPSQLAPRLGVTRPSITALVDGLVARGYVERRPDAEDRRRVRHRMTTAGREALGGADRAIEARLEHIASYLPARDAARALDGLALWNAAVIAAIAAERAAGTR